jgi:DNA-binding winged helix-turn-helix (wHTH) protein
MSKLSAAGRLDHHIEELRQILRDLDTSQSTCEGCERTGYLDKVEGHSAQAIKAAITRLARAAVELREAEED